jgi:hypothetical protein
MPKITLFKVYLPRYMDEFKALFSLDGSDRLQYIEIISLSNLMQSVVCGD